MPRLPRFAPIGVPQHIIQRGNNRQPCFGEEHDYGVYTRFLKSAADKFSVDIHAWCFMSNHVHLLATPKSDGAVSLMMQSLGRRYVQYFNHKYKRTGTLWEGRFKSCMVDTEAYLLICYRYIELNPVRAKIVKQPEDYKWSSHSLNIGNKESELITPHEIYKRLATAEEERFKVYKELFREELTNIQIENIRAATNRGLLVGSEKFRNEIEELIGQSVRPNPVGRPKVVNEEGAVYFC
jgi:putative transposase